MFEEIELSYPILEGIDVPNPPTENEIIKEGRVNTKKDGPKK